MPRLLAWTAPVAVASLAAWLASCTFEVANHKRDEESLTVRSEIYGPGSPRRRAEPDSPANPTEIVASLSEPGESGELSNIGEDAAPSPPRAEIDPRRLDEPVPSFESLPESRFAEWLNEAERRTQAAVLHAQLRQIEELLELLDDAELKSLDSLESVAPGAAPLDRRLDLFRDLRRRLAAQRHALQQSLNARPVGP